MRTVAPAPLVLLASLVVACGPDPGTGEEAERLRRENLALQAQVRDDREARATAERRVAELEAELEETQQRAGTLAVRLQAAAKNTETQRRRVDAARAEVRRLREEVDELRRMPDKAFQDALEMVKEDNEALRRRLEGKEDPTADKLREATEQLAVLEKKTADLRLDVGRLELLLGRYRQHFGALPQPPPGAVLAVHEGFVALSVGRKDGVKTGQAFRIQRGPERVGRVRIERVYADMAVARIEGVTKAVLQQGDRAQPADE